MKIIEVLILFCKLSEQHQQWNQYNDGLQWSRDHVYEYVLFSDNSIKGLLK